MKKKTVRSKKKVKALKKMTPKVKAKSSRDKTLVKSYQHHPDHYNTSESYLVDSLEDDFKDAWKAIRAYGASLGQQRIYASGRAIMFSRKVCYFFVRPQKKYLEVVVFLQSKWPGDYFKSVRAVSKTKFSHTFRLVHADQIEGDLVEAIARAYAQTPAD